jgi:hypothetical protein
MAPPAVGTLYRVNYNGIPWTQPGGAFTTVFPQQQNGPFVAYPVLGQFFSELSGLFLVGCGHSVDLPKIFNDVGLIGGIQMVAVCCPLCSFIQYYAPLAQYYDLSSTGATPITLI